MPDLICRSCGHRNDVSARQCQECGAPEEELRGGADLGPWWPLLGIFAALGVGYAVARVIGTTAVLVWLALTGVICIGAGACAVRERSLQLRGNGPLGAIARLQGLGLLALGVAALAIFVGRIVLGS